MTTGCAVCTDWFALVRAATLGREHPADAKATAATTSIRCRTRHHRMPAGRSKTRPTAFHHAIVDERRPHRCRVRWDRRQGRAV